MLVGYFQTLAVSLQSKDTGSTCECTWHGISMFMALKSWSWWHVTIIFAIYAEFHSQIFGEKFGIKLIKSFRQKWSRIEQSHFETQAICSFDHAALGLTCSQSISEKLRSIHWVTRHQSWLTTNFMHSWVLKFPHSFKYALWQTRKVGNFNQNSLQFVAYFQPIFDMIAATTEQDPKQKKT